jgi:hypothetical protein
MGNVLRLLSLCFRLLRKRLSLFLLKEVEYRVLLCIGWEPLDSGQSCVFDVRFVILMSEHSLMVHEDFRWESFENPIMLKGLQRSHSVHWVPVEALVNEIEEVGIVAAKDILKLLGEWLSLLTFGVGDYDGLVLLVEEEFLPASQF